MTGSRDLSPDLESPDAEAALSGLGDSPRPADRPPPKMTTACGACVFAPPLNDPAADCGTGRLSRYRELGLATTAEDGTPLINGRLCNTCWKPDAPWVDETPTEERAKEARRRAAVRFRGVVLVDEPTAVEDVLASLRGLFEQSLPPVEVAVVLAAPAPKYGGLVLAVRAAAPPVPWRVRLADDVDGGPPAALDRELVENPGSASHAAVVKPGRPFPRDWFERYDRLVNDEMAMLPAVGRRSESSVHGLTVGLAVWRADPGYCLDAPWVNTLWTE